MDNWIDVSNLNGVIDWPAVATASVGGRPIVGAWIKASEGTTFVDSFLGRNAAGARMAGLRVGFYHFGRPLSNSGQAEAAFFGRVTSMAERADLLALDLEEDPPPGTDLSSPLWTADLLAYTLDFLTHAVAPWRGVLYSRAEYMSRHNLMGSFDLAQYGLWLASYQDSRPPIPRPWQAVSFWQYSAVGQITGINGDVDLDYKIS